MWQGALIAVFANFLVSLSLTVQKLAHIKNEAATEAARAIQASLDPKDRSDGAIASKGYWQLPWWWLGVSIDAVGEVGNVIAYGYAPTFVVAPLGATTVVFNSIFAVVILKERFRWKDVACLLAIFVGIVMIVYSNEGESQPPLTIDETINTFFNTWQSIALVSVSLATIVCLQLYIYLRRTAITSMFPFLWNASIIAMYTVLCSKAAVMWMRAPEAGHPTQLPHVLLWVMVASVLITAIWNTHYLQMALQAFDSSLTIPTYFTLFTFCCVIGAALLFQEFAALSPLTMALFVIGLSLSIVGVFLLARRGGTIAETAITQLLHRGLAASPTVRRCHTSGGRIFAESSSAVLSPRMVYQQDLEAAKGGVGITSNALHSLSLTSVERDTNVEQSFAEALLMQVGDRMRAHAPPVSCDRQYASVHCVLIFD
jgi:drug/metabolite transporter (DMT)-like permease